MAKSALGKGLSALIGTRPSAIRLETEPGENVHQVSLGSIVPSPLQPRKDFARDSLDELVASIRQHDLHDQVQAWLTQGLLSVGHAKVLLALKEPEEQLLVAETILRRSATVRATERLVARQLGITRPRRKRQTAATTVTPAMIGDLQTRLQEHLGTRVTLHHGEKRGCIEIVYYGNDDLQRVLTALGLSMSET